MTLWPKSLGGQLAVLLLAGVAAAHVASFLIVSVERGRAIRGIYLTQTVERFASLVEAVEAVPPDVADRLLRSVSSRRFRLSIDPRSLASADMDSRETLFADALRRDLPAETGEVRVGSVEGRPSGRQGRVRSGRNRGGVRALQISIRLSDGRWLNGVTPRRPPPVRWSWPWLTSLILSAATILALVALVVRRVTQPIRALARAADDVGRGEEVPPLTVRGPAEIRSATEAFNLMQARLTRFVRDRTRMIAAMSHDLRTPITALRLRAELVEDEETRDSMVRTLDDMRSIVDATLAFARDDSLGEETRWVDLGALVDGLCQDMIAAGYELTCEEIARLPYRCRPASLRRALTNLIENATRYGERATVCLSREPGSVVISVEDEGPGIPPQSLDDVFEPFARLESSRSSETGGVGLGLSIARSIAHSHGGEITLQNRRNGGLRATITLPEMLEAAAP